MATSVMRARRSACVPPGAAERTRSLPWGVLAAAVGVAVWLAADPRTPDLAGQVYRASLFREVGLMVWDSRWYAGHAMPGYSLLFPPLAAWLGVRAVGAAAVLASAAIFERIAQGVYGRRAARWGSVWFAGAALSEVWSGQVTFALGVSFALGAVLALQPSRAFALQPSRAPALQRGAPAAAALAGVSAACSPVAGALVALAGLTHALVARSPRSLLVLAGPPAVVVGASVALFGEGGWEPYPFYSLLATFVASVAFMWALPPGHRLLRVGTVVYLAACLACVAVHTPMGGNVERYGVLLAGPLLLCAVGVSGAPLSYARAWVLLGLGVWTVWGPARETTAVAGGPATSSAYYLPVERCVAAHGGSTVRVEVPLTRGHWEAAWLAAHVSLARGWEKQLDERYDGPLLGGGLTAARYRTWLEREAVQYVALPDAPLDPSSAAEGRLIERGLPYLREVAGTRHWRIYAVLDATPLASGPGALIAVGHDWFALRARAGGRFTVRVRYTRYFTVTAGAACVRAEATGWTEVSAMRPGRVAVRASFSFARALGLAGTSCHGAASQGTALAGARALTARGGPPEAAGGGSQGWGVSPAGAGVSRYAASPQAPRLRSWAQARTARCTRSGRGAGCR
jgi:hypothetical protein